ncbi:uncharacterized protein A4U43_C01F12600 [Asparagus officinalis]|uniref:Uncharacterized protein n=1 Tax=Asparagus officinalis TaxID=4686 RepID=A0A5P1FPF1_ASPOF|nr:uncharacterized protein A4U43_C01F12600 [Asparagus officinalis]
MTLTSYLTRGLIVETELFYCYESAHELFFKLQVVVSAHRDAHETVKVLAAKREDELDQLKKDQVEMERKLTTQTDKIKPTIDLS